MNANRRLALSPGEIALLNFGSVGNFGDFGNPDREVAAKPKQNSGQASLRLMAEPENLACFNASPLFAVIAGWFRSLAEPAHSPSPRVLSPA
jgi:hypothetical protein